VLLRTCLISQVCCSVTARQVEASVLLLLSVVLLLALALALVC
jgi:hypothetical protein